MSVFIVKIRCNETYIFKIHIKIWSFDVSISIKYYFLEFRLLLSRFTPYCSSLPRTAWKGPHSLAREKNIVPSFCKKCHNEPFHGKHFPQKTLPIQTPPAKYRFWTRSYLAPPPIRCLGSRYGKPFVPFITDKINH